MKIKHAVIILVLGVFAGIAGALFKIEHWAGADALLLSAMALETSGLVLLAVKVLARPGANQFLNS